MKSGRGNGIENAFIINIRRAKKAKYFVDMEIFRVEVDFPYFTYKTILLEIEILGVSLKAKGVDGHAE
jgi:hypothetical protein